MQLNIQIKLDNEAYQDSVGYELGENLSNVIERIGVGSRSGTIHDINGNKTGYWIITEED